jgi:hypothetical protein
MLRDTTMPPSEMTANLGRAAADVDDEAPGRLADRETGADRGRHRLFDQAGPAGARVERRVSDGALLDLGDARRDAEQHPRPRDQPEARVDLVHEVLDHLLGHVEVADDPVAERPDRDDARRRPADHPLGLGADRQDRFVLASIATTDGSLITIPRSRTWTSVFAVPRSIPMSREKSRGSDRA